MESRDIGLMIIEYRYIILIIFWVIVALFGVYLAALYKNFEKEAQEISDRFSQLLKEDHDGK